MMADLLDGPSSSSSDRLMTRPGTATILILCTVGAFNTLTLATMQWVPMAPCNFRLSGIERQVTLVAATIHTASLLLDFFSKQQLGGAPGLRHSINCVKGIAATTNFLLLAMDTPFVVDPMTGRPNCMLRWAEWTVLSFTMTFIVEAVDATSVRLPLLSAGSQSLSTFLGMLLPLCPLALWKSALALSFALYFVIFWRLAAIEAALRDARRTLPPHSVERRRAELSAALMRQCVATWTALVVVWCADVIGRLLVGDPSTDWAYVADCAIDVVAKTLYATAIQEQFDAEPIRHEQQRHRILEERQRILWNEASDVLIVSQRWLLPSVPPAQLGVVEGGGSDGGGGLRRRRSSNTHVPHSSGEAFTVVTVASPSVRTLLGRHEADAWIKGRVHQLEVVDTLPTVQRVSSESDLFSLQASRKRGSPEVERRGSPEVERRGNPEVERRGNPEVERRGAHDGTVFKPRSSADAKGRGAHDAHAGAFHCEQLEDLLALAWAHSGARSSGARSFTCVLAPTTPCRDDAMDEAKRASDDDRRQPQKEEGQHQEEHRHQQRLCEVTYSSNDDEAPGGTAGLVIIVREVTDRVMREEAERAALYERAAREKDEEANCFTQHEVKNSLLAALATCEALHSAHTYAVMDGALEERFVEPIRDRLTELSAGLNHTLDTCLSRSIASDVVYGVHEARPVPIKLDHELLQSWGQGGDSSRFPVTTSPAALPIVYTDPRLLRHIYRNAITNAVKYGKRNGLVATEVEQHEEWLVLRVINEPGDRHAELRRLQPSSIFEKGTRFHPDHPTVVSSKGDGAWIMQRCAECLQGSCTIAFEPHRTVFELRCEAHVRHEKAMLDDESILDYSKLAEGVWAIGIDDCDLQRMVLEHIFARVGVPAMRTQVWGAEVEHMERLTEKLVELVEGLPAGDRLLAIVDENLDLPAPCSTTISGSASLQQARERLGAASEAKLICLVRSANDSPDDVRLYMERAHGFLPKVPVEPDYRAVLRTWVRRFGKDSLTTSRPAYEGGAASEVLTTPHLTRAAADAELRKVIRLIQDNLASMTWSEMCRWLHHIKGVAVTVMAADSSSDAPTSAEAIIAEIIAEIESLHPLTERPSNFVGRWALLSEMIADLLDYIEESA